MTIEEARAFIDECTKRLKGPLSQIERALICADRKDAREWLAANTASTTPTLDKRNA